MSHCHLNIISQNIVESENLIKIRLLILEIYFSWIDESKNDCIKKQIKCNSNVPLVNAHVKYRMTESIKRRMPVYRFLMHVRHKMTYEWCVCLCVRVYIAKRKTEKPKVSCLRLKIQFKNEYIIELIAYGLCHNSTQHTLKL